MWNELNLNIRTKWYKEHSKNHHRIQSNPDYDECLSACVVVCVFEVFMLRMEVQNTKLYSPQSFIKEDENDKIERERERDRKNLWLTKKEPA